LKALAALRILKLSSAGIFWQEAWKRGFCDGRQRMIKLLHANTRPMAWYITEIVEHTTVVLEAPADQRRLPPTNSAEYRCWPGYLGPCNRPEVIPAPTANPGQAVTHFHGAAHNR
jgi:hypothetical protein